MDKAGLIILFFSSSLLFIRLESGSDLSISHPPFRLNDKNPPSNEGGLHIMSIKRASQRITTSSIRRALALCGIGLIQLR